MRIYLAGIALIGLLSAGCSSDWDPARAGHATVESGDTAAQGLPTASLSSRSGTPSFASLPDRGELLRYSPDRKARRSGAYTSHPVEISEAHALNAIATGELRLNTPNGKPLAVAFDHIEEHPDGNWTWVGGDDAGNNAVLTFGERAVFGEITSAGQSFRVTMRGGGAWLVETDHAMLAGTGRGQPRQGPDFLIPPSATTESGASMAGSKAMAAAAATAAPKAAPGVIDVALGYTNGLVSKYGSQAAAVTRITNMAALTNAAYQRSGVNMRIRLVRTTLVNYADNNSNRDTLQKLTGYNVDTGQPVTPDSAFNTLRAERDEFGADLVALVRPHRSPEQDGCGIAWLLGAGQSGIDAGDAPFGYSVVSEGDDVNEGDNFTYFCSDYSLAHELGHSMGQAHNEDDAEYAGVHPYSYGYRETSTTGFYTIMAYPIEDSSQIEINHFANPAVNNVGRPTGVANESDNVRSMNITMPIVATFRATKVPLIGLSNDFDGDGKSDVLFRNSSNGENVIWKSANSSTRQQMTAVTNQAWTIVGTGDFNIDGKSDVLWRNTKTGANTVWRSGSGASSDRLNLGSVTNLKWQVVGVGDFNGDGASDILWRRSDNGDNLIWASGNTSTRIAVATVTGGGWAVAGVGDFNGDGKSDILWRSTTSGKNTIWKSGNTSTRQGVDTVANTKWQVAGIGDFNGDGVDDVLWRNPDTGGNVIWLSANGGTRLAVASVNTGWFVAAIADYDGDGRADILWRNSSSGKNIIWKSGNTATRQAMTTVPSSAWKIFY